MTPRLPLPKYSTVQTSLGPPPGSRKNGVHLHKKNEKGGLVVRRPVAPTGSNRDHWTQKQLWRALRGRRASAIKRLSSFKASSQRYVHRMSRPVARSQARCSFWTKTGIVLSYFQLRRCTVSSPFVLPACPGDIHEKGKGGQATNSSWTCRLCKHFCWPKDFQRGFHACASRCWRLSGRLLETWVAEFHQFRR